MQILLCNLGHKLRFSPKIQEITKIGVYFAAAARDVFAFSHPSMIVPMANLPSMSPQESIDYSTNYGPAEVQAQDSACWQCLESKVKENKGMRLICF